VGAFECEPSDDCVFLQRFVQTRLEVCAELPRDSFANRVVFEEVRASIRRIFEVINLTSLGLMRSLAIRMCGAAIREGSATNIESVACVRWNISAASTVGLIR